MNNLTPAEIAEVLEEGRVAHIGVVADGEPYVTPLSYVPFGNGIAFRSLAGRRLDAIAKNPRVSVEVTLVDDATGSWKSVVATGDASVVDDSREAAEVIQLVLQRYAASFESLLGDKGPALTRASVVRVEFDDVTGRGSDGHLQPRTRPGRL